ncbi:hypothetical protein F1D61_05530 [Methylobacterium aquaticum]|nr:hypothetical protein F1D61_05530 [Methylobacterium aquaticum]
MRRPRRALAPALHGPSRVNRSGFPGGCSSRVRRLPCQGHAARLAERGVADIDAPVSGGTAGAGAGPLDDVDRLGRAVRCPAT